MAFAGSRYGVLYSFCGNGGSCPHGANPQAGVIRAASGNLYGTTGSGGAHNRETVFELTPPAQSGDTWTETALYSFCPVLVCPDGQDPTAGLIYAAGSLYGSTGSGGLNNSGTVFVLVSPAKPGGLWAETVLQLMLGWPLLRRGDSHGWTDPERCGQFVRHCRRRVWRCWHCVRSCGWSLQGISCAR
jgi:uncharacterized repeat protein (TIGR03803 family)